MNNLTKDMTKIILGERSIIPFIPYTYHYGNASFIFIPKFQSWDNALVKFMIFPKGQKNIKTYWEWEGKGSEINHFTLMSNPLDKLEQPSSWLHYYIREYDTYAFDVRVPEGSNTLHFTEYSVWLDLEFKKDQTLPPYSSEKVNNA